MDINYELIMQNEGVAEWVAPFVICGLVGAFANAPR